MRTTHALAALALVATSLTAQHSFTLPELYTGSNATGGNLLPFNRTRGFIQYFHDGDNWPSTRLVLQMGVRAGASSYAAMSHKMEIYLSNTAVTYNAINTTYANNLGTNSTKWLAMTTLNIPANNAVNPDPDTPFYWIKGDRPFIFNDNGGKEPNLIIQFDIQTSTTYAGGGVNTQSLNGGNQILSTDTSCGGTLTGSYPSPNVAFTLTGARPNLPVVYLVGAHLLPVDLGAIWGGTGCTTVVNPLLLLPAAADASGSHSWQAPWSPPKASVVHVQGLHMSTATTTGWATTNCVHMGIGGTAGLCTYLYNWTRDGATCEYGPYTTDRGPVFLFK